jgi:hypothetical protein
MQEKNNILTIKNNLWQVLIPAEAIAVTKKDQE